MENKINDYLSSVAKKYNPKRSKDPDENECFTCGLTETLHTSFHGNYLTCDNFE